MTKRIHGDSAIGGGHIGYIDDKDFLGECPSCGAALTTALIAHPVTGREARVLVHPLPFCTYYADTDPSDIARDIAKALQERKKNPS